MTRIYILLGFTPISQTNIFHLFLISLYIGGSDYLHVCNSISSNYMSDFAPKPRCFTLLCRPVILLLFIVTERFIRHENLSPDCRHLALFLKIPELLSIVVFQEEVNSLYLFVQREMLFSYITFLGIGASTLTTEMGKTYGTVLKYQTKHSSSRGDTKAT